MWRNYLCVNVWRCVPGDAVALFRLPSSKPGVMNFKFSSVWPGRYEVVVNHESGSLCWDMEDGVPVESKEARSQVVRFRTCCPYRGMLAQVVLTACTRLVGTDHRSGRRHCRCFIRANGLCHDHQLRSRARCASEP